MNKFAVTTLFVLLLGIGASAQAPRSILLPIKENGRWGLYDMTNSQVVVEPAYDRIGDRATWGIKIINGDKVGLVNPAGRVLAEPQYKDIIPLNRGYCMLIFEDGTKNVLDLNNGEIQLAGNDFSKVTPIRAGYFLVEKQGKWGAVHNSGKTTVPLVHDHLSFSWQFQELLITTDKSSGLKGLVGLEDGKTILPNKHLGVTPISKGYSIVKGGDGLGLVAHKDGALLLPSNYSRIHRLSDYFIVAGHGGAEPTDLYSLGKREFVTLGEDYDGFAPFDKSHFLASNNGKWGLIGKDGRVLVPANYDNIRELEGSKQYFKVYKGQLCGLYDVVNQRMATEIAFRGIALENGLFRMVGHHGMGVYNRRMEEVIPLEYDRLTIRGRTIKARKEKLVASYWLDEQQNVEDFEEYREVHSLRIGYRTSAIVEQDTAVTVNGSPLNQGPRVTFPDARYEWVEDPEVARSAYRLIGGEDILSEFQYIPYDIPNTPYSIAQGEGKVACPDLLTITLGGGWALRPFQLFDRENGRFSQADATGYLGMNFRDLKRGKPYMRVIFSDGQFGLMDKGGRLLLTPSGEPFKAAYIGTAVNGRMRFAVGGEWTTEVLNIDSRATISRGSLIKEFNLDMHYTDDARPKLRVGLKDGAWGFLDERGKIVISPEYEGVEDFTSEKKSICKKEGMLGMIDPDNRPVLSFEYDNIELSETKDYYQLTKKNKGGASFVVDKLGNQVSDSGEGGLGELQEGRRWAKADGKWGFVDEAGSVAVPFEYDSLADFSEGHSLAMKDSVFFLIDKNGNPKLKGKPYEVAGNVKDGLVRIRQNGKYGYADTNGNIAIPPKFVMAFDFDGGVARVVVARKTGLIDTKGDFVLAPKDYDLIFPFNEEGVAIVEPKQFGKKGLVNRQGGEVMPPLYQEIEPFKDGYARVKNGKRYGLVSADGKEIIPPNNYNMDHVKEGKIAVQPLRGGPWYFMDMEGNVLFDGLEMTAATQFQDSVAIIRHKNADDLNTKSILHANGDILGTLLYNDKQRIFTMANPEGDTLLHERLEIDLAFHSKGMLVFTKTKYYDLKREKSRVSYHYTPLGGDGLELGREDGYARLFPFIEGVAVARITSTMALMDMKGVLITTPKFKSVRKNKEGNYIATPAAFSGVASLDGKIVLDAEYDFFNRELFSGNGVFRVEQGDQLGYMDSRGNWVWELRR